MKGDIQTCQSGDMFAFILLRGSPKSPFLTMSLHIPMKSTSIERNHSWGDLFKDANLLSFHQKYNVVVQSLSHIQFSVTPWTAAHQASLFFTVSQSLHKLMSFESVMPSNHLILCHPLLLLPSVFPSIRVFSTESAVCIR